MLAVSSDVVTLECTSDCRLLSNTSYVQDDDDFEYVQTLARLAAALILLQLHNRRTFLQELTIYSLEVCNALEFFDPYMGAYPNLSDTPWKRSALAFLLGKATLLA